MTRAALKTFALRLAQVELAKLGAGVDDTALDAAVARYNQDMPRLTTATLTMVDGGANLPDEFEAGFSAVREVECPLDQRPPSYLRSEGYYIYDAIHALRIEVLATSSDAMRVQFTVRHVASDSVYTIPEYHTEAVASWAAAILCEMEASRFSGKTSTTISADSMDQSNPARQFAARAKTLRQRYFDELGVDPKRAAPASVDVSFTKRDSRGRLPLVHPLPVLQSWN